MASALAGLLQSRADKADGLHPSAALGTLINLAGRQRMLSHQTVMFLALVRADRPSELQQQFIASAKAALRDFTKGKSILLDGDSVMGLPPLFSSRAKALFELPVDPLDPHFSGSGLLNQFISLTQAYILRIEGPDQGADDDLIKLSSLTAGKLLAFLNRLVLAFEADLAEAHQLDAARNLEVRKIILATITNIETLGDKINLAAFSAIIEAARAADEGQTFAVIASEIKALSSQTQAEATRMGLAIHQLFEPQI